MVEESSPTQTVSPLSKSSGGGGSRAKKRFGRQCVCGRKAECQGISAAFKLMGDPRKGYVQLPPFQEYPSSPIAKELNGLRASYLRHLSKTEQDIATMEEPLFVALHHFHPIVVQKHSESSKSSSPIPKTVKPVDIKFLKLSLGEEDRVLDANGVPTRQYYFAPCYSVENTKNDLKRLIRVSRMVTEAKTSPRSQESKSPSKPQSPPPAQQSPHTPKNGVSNVVDPTQKLATKSKNDDDDDTAKAIARTTEDANEEKKEAGNEIENGARDDMSLEPIPSLEVAGSTDETDKSVDGVLSKRTPLERMLDRVPEPTEVEESRRALIEKMVRFELRRREVYHRRIEEAASVWRGAMEVMQAGIFETARAERLVKGTAFANKAYADAMRAVANDVYIDGEGNAVNGERRQTRMKSQRATLLDDGDGMLSSLAKYHNDMGAKFDDVTKRIMDEPVAEFRVLRRDLKVNMIAIKRQGDSFIRNMKAAEVEVLRAWNMYDKIGAAVVSHDALAQSLHSTTSEVSSISTSLHGGSAHGSSVAASPKSPADAGSVNDKSSRFLFGRSPDAASSLPAVDENNNSQRGASWRQLGVDGWEHDAKRALHSPVGAAIKAIGDVQDGWLAEWFYRLAVDQQSSIWDLCSTQLSKLHKTVLEFEVNRQLKVHQLILDFMPRERRLFLAVAPLPKPVLKSLVDDMETAEEAGRSVDDHVQKQMQTILRNAFAQRSTIMNRSRAVQPKFDEKLEPPAGEFFDNGLMKASKVLERKTGVYVTWKTTLAVATVDGILHLFDLTNFPEHMVGSKSSVVLETMRPNCELPTMETAGAFQPRVDPLLKNLTPVDTINLPSSTIQVDSADPRCVDITTAVSGRFTNVRKFVLRTTGREESLKWLGILKELAEQQPGKQSNGKETS